MLPEDCQEYRGSMENPISALTNGWFMCTFGYNEPDEVRASVKTANRVLMPGVVSFRDARVVFDESVPDGIVELHNSSKPNHPLYNGRIIFEDF